MSGYNKVILIGNLTRDPELRYTPQGVAIAKIGLAINRKWKTQDGETKEEVTFVDVDAYRGAAETLAQYLKKGSPLMVDGRLKLDQWEDRQTGQKRSRLGVVLEHFTFLGGGNRSDDSGGGTAKEQLERARKAAGGGGTHETDDMPPPEDDDVPF